MLSACDNRGISIVINTYVAGGAGEQQQTGQGKEWEDGMHVKDSACVQSQGPLTDSPVTD